jgi:hypothetical protein
MLAFILSLALAIPASDSLSVDDAQELGNRLALCAGAWDFLAEVEAQEKRPSSAKQAADTARGAMLAAQYVMFIYHAASSDKEPRALESFGAMFEGPRESGRTRLAAMIEREDFEGFSAEIDACGELLPVQESIINQIRRQYSE